MADKMTAVEVRGAFKLIQEMRARTYFAEADAAGRVLGQMRARGLRDDPAGKARP